MKALIIYQNLASAAKASSALQRAAQHADASVHWSISTWRVDMLKFPPTAAEALADAADVHLIVFAGDIKPSLPFWLQLWLEHWAQRRQIENAALAVFCEGIADVLPVPATLELSCFAACHGLGFIFDDRATVDSSSDEDRPLFSEGRLPECEPSLSPILPQTPDAKLRDAYRGWDITG
ncbi:MAG TPA: hypothetical protein VK815_06200 [Candidatus Acidoferrales bacterium]|jgi:hypothetical protein|nr:hypothetical protein [Candidatus Acidoferrales bacterium]